MYYLSIIYNSPKILPEEYESFSENLGMYGFQEIPRIGETITIKGSGSYIIKNIEHTFVKKSKSEQAEIVYLTKIYVS